MMSQSRMSVPPTRRHRITSHACHSIAIFVVASLLLGCSATPRILHADPNTLAESGYDFIHDGVATRDELRMRLGEPVYKFENSRILIYRCRKIEKGIMLLSGIQPEPGQLAANILLGAGAKAKEAAHSDLGSLVLVFDANGILQKHSLVVSK